MDIDNLMLHSDEDETNEDGLDEDNCTEKELQEYFPLKYDSSIEQALSLNNNYILHLDCTNEAKPKICVGLSNGNSEIYEFTENQLNKIHEFEDVNNIGVKFISDCLLYTGNEKVIKLWDLRTSKCVSSFIDNTDSSPEATKIFLTFDVSPNNRLLCGGTELNESDAFLVFWDVRNAKLLGGYWESHTDDITKVLFHPTDNNKLASGSTDGLVNIFDLTETTEDDALKDSLNTESSVEQVYWYKDNNDYSLCCVTHTGETQLWNVEDAVPYTKYTREDIANGIKRKSPDHCYVANIHEDNNGNLILLAGSNWKNGECLRSLKVTKDHGMTPNICFLGNKQRIRASCYKNDLFVTGGERGILAIWKRSSDVNNTMLKNINTMKKSQNRGKPY